MMANIKCRTYMIWKLPTDQSESRLCLFSRSTSAQDNYNEIIIASEHPAQLNNFPMMCNIFLPEEFFQVHP